jgi:hypothetical protein
MSLHARMQSRGTQHPGEASPWEIAIVGYQYTLLDADQHEILAFHLHPEGRSHVTTPHLHLGAGAGQLRSDLGAAHVPTGTVTLAAVARLATEDLVPCVPPGTRSSVAPTPRSPRRVDAPARRVRPS